VPENDTRRLPRRNAQSPSPQLAPPASETPEFAAQAALALLLRAPERQLLASLQEVAPGKDVGFHSRALQVARAAIEKTIEVLHKPTANDPAPVLIDRLSFSWTILRQADVLVRRLRKAEMPARTDLGFARSVLGGLLGGQLADPFLLEVLNALRLGEDARFLHHYWFFRKATTPTKLPSPLGEATRNGELDTIRRVIWWLLRASREQYVQVTAGEPVRIEFEWLVEKILDELSAWCGPEVQHVPAVAGEIESELNRWLAYSQVESGTTDDGAVEIARAFVKFNDLETKLIVAGRSPNVSADSRVIALQAALSEHQATIREYSEENRRLEEQLAQLKASQVTEPEATAAKSTDIAAPDLREFLKLIDSKYSFDALNAVNLGNDSHLTLRSFVAHLFYSLRKRGFGEYPTADEFALSYEESGLYDCDGFEVPPGETRRVRVLKRGWALVSKERTLPVRRARVALAASAPVGSQ
jgi:hypothetical protein